ncbi:Orphan protein [Pseudoalteromonas distincta]
MSIIYNYPFGLSTMKHLSKSVKTLGASLLLASAFVTQPALANGPIGEHVNHLQANLKSYAEEVEWMVGKVDTMVSDYDKKGAKAVKTDDLIEYWESVKFHSAIETNFVPVYASIWQGIYGVKMAIENGKPAAEVRKEQEAMNIALWQGLGAVKLAAKFQQKGLLESIKATATTEMTQSATIDEIKHKLDRVVAKFAERLQDEATDIVHDTYLHLFEGVEGTLIEQDANLVEVLEKDFNVTLPQAIKNSKSVDDIRDVVSDMQTKLDRAKTLIEKAEKSRKDVF